MNDVTPVNTFTSPVQVVEDGDSVDGANELVTIQALVNRDTNLNARLAAIEAALGLDSHGTAILVGDSSSARPTLQVTGNNGHVGTVSTGGANAAGARGVGGADGNGLEGTGTGTGLGLKLLKGGSATNAASANGNIDLSTAANPASTAAFTNHLTPANLPKAWASVTTNGAGAASVDSGFNIASVSITTFDLVVNLAAGFSATTDYAAFSIGSGGTVTISHVINKVSGTQIKIRANDAFGSALNWATASATIGLFVFGKQ